MKKFFPIILSVLIASLLSFQDNGEEFNLNKITRLLGMIDSNNLKKLPPESEIKFG